MLIGLNHITLAVSDLEQSLEFYVSTLGMKLEVTWKTGAYLSLGSLWICLSKGKPQPAKDYSHIAFSIDESDFDQYCSKRLSSGVEIWQENRSEGKSHYILDPDGHRLEIHVGDLQSRLDALKKAPYPGMEWH